MAKTKEAKESKYYLTAHKELEDKPVYTGKQVSENTKVQTVNGEILVTAPNYVFTDSDGNSFGVAEADVKNLYTVTKG